jgi:peptide/nickel transport system substrate-binding protein
MARRKLTRKEFLVATGATAAGALLAACAPAATPAPTAPPPAPTAVPPTAAPPTKAPAPTAVPPTAVPAPTKAAVPAAGKILKYRMYLDVENLDPARRISANDGDVADTVLRGLVRYKAGTYEIYNDLAESCKQTDPLTIEFKLREGVKWDRDFGEVTTEDVKFSYERFRDPALKAAYADDWAALDKVEIVDKYRGKIILKQTSAPLWKTTLPVGSGNIVCKKHVEKVGLDAFKTDLVGCGPYNFIEWRPKDRVILRRNPSYFGPPALFDEIQCIPILDDKAAEVAIQADEIDYSRIAIGSIDRFQKDPKIKALVTPALRFRCMGFNVESPKLKDVNVRNAIRWAVDVPAILQAGYSGKAEQETGLIAPGLLGYWKDAPKYTRDVAKAKDFMQKAGLTTLDITYTYQNTSEYQTWGEVAQQNLKDIGINLKLNPLERAAYSGIGFREEGKALELFNLNFSMQPDPSWATVWFVSAQIPGWNYMRWSNKEYDALHQKGLTSTDDKERDQIYIQMQQIWDKDAICVWITHGVMSYAYWPRIKPVTTPHGLAQLEFFAPA